MEKYIIYLRKSRADGEHETIEEVLERHERILQDYAQQKFGGPVPEEDIYREIVSGETIKDRPMINIVLERIQNEKITGVLVVEPQRLSRGDLHDCGTIIRAFQYTDTLIITPPKVYNLFDKFDRKFFEMELMRGNDYLEYIKEILMRGRLASVNEGNYIGSVPPYGYKKVKNGKFYTLVENEESDVVRMIFEMFACEHLGTTKIANKLNAMGIKPRKNNYWSDSTIRDILRNPVYIGKIRWNWRKTVKKYKDGEIVLSRPKTDKNEWILIDGKHEGIISEELFNTVQEYFGKMSPVKSKSEIVNPFAGLVYCNCGKKIVYKKSRTASPRLVCPNQPKCKNKSVLYSEFEEEILKMLRTYIADFKTKITDNQNSSEKVQSDVIKTLNKELEGIEKQQDNLYDLLEQGVYSKAVFLKRNNALAEKRELALSALEDAKKALNSSINYAEIIVRMSQAADALQNPDISPKIKNALLKSIIDKIHYSHSPDSPLKSDSNPAFHVEIFLKF